MSYLVPIFGARLDDANSDQEYLYPTDLAALVGWLTSLLSPNGSITTSTATKSFLEEWFDQSGAGFSERSLVQKHYHQLVAQIQQCNTSFQTQTSVSPDLVDETVEDTQPETSRDTQTQTSPPRFSTALVSPNQDEGGSESATDVAETETESPTTKPTTTSPTQQQSTQSVVLDDHQRARLIRYETTWLYHHVAYNLFGQHGIDIMGDFEIEGQLQTTISNHLQKKYGDADLRRMFADPSKRLVVLGEIYELYAQNSIFVGTVRAKYDQHLDAIKDKPIELKEFLEKTKYEPSSPSISLPKPIVPTDIQAELAHCLESLLGQKIDGASQLNLQKALAAVSTVSLVNQVGEITKSNQQTGDVITLVKNLSPDQLVAIFLANHDGSVDQQLIDKLKNDPSLLAMVKGVLQSTLALSTLEIRAGGGLIRQNTGVLGSQTDMGRVSSSTIQSIQVVRAIMPTTGGSQKDVADAINQDEHLSHSQELLNAHEERIRKMWTTLDQETQLNAYRVVRGLKPGEKVDYIPNSDGTIPWDSLLMLVRWDEFLRKEYIKRGRKDLEDRRQKLDKERLEAAERLKKRSGSTLLRSDVAKGFVAGMSSQQVEALQNADLLNKLEETSSFSESVATQLSGGLLITLSTDHLLAVDSIRIAQLTIDEQLARIADSTPNQFAQRYAQRLRELKESLTASQSVLLEPLLQHGSTTSTQGVSEPLLAKPGDYSSAWARVEQQQRLVAASTLLLEVQLGAPTILLATIADDQQGAGANDLALAPLNPVSDVEELGLPSLMQAADTYNNRLLGDKQHPLDPQQRASVGLENAAIARGLAKIAVQGQGTPWGTVIAAGKTYFADAQFRQAINNKIKQHAKLLASLGIAVGTAGYLVFRYILGTLGAKAGLVLGGVAGGAAGAALGSILIPIPVVGTVVGGLIGGSLGAYAGYGAGAKIAAEQALLGAGEMTAGEAAQAGLGGSTATSAGIGSGTQGGAGASSAIPPGWGGSTSPTITDGPTSGVAYGGGGTSGVGGASGVSGATPAPTLIGATATSPTAVGATTGATVASSAAATAASGVALGGTIAGLSIAVLAPMVGLVAVTTMSMYTMYVIFSAFLTPLPIGDDTQLNATESQYLSISKVADPKSLTDNSTKEVRYTIAMKTKSRYKIRLTSLVDTANNGFEFASARTPHTNPTITPGGPYISLLDFGQDPFVGTKQYTYKVTMSGGSGVMVKNRVTITYDVLDSNDHVVKSGETISASANVGIGDHGIACWPTTGRISQLPLVPGSYSHANLDAYDIGASLGTKVFSPVSGFATYPPFMNGGYGNYVLISFDNNGRQDTFIFAHLSSSTIPRAGKDVEVGELIGRVGSTGMSTGPHLHFGIQPAGTVGRSRLDQYLLLNNIQPPTNGTRVYSCYD